MKRILYISLLLFISVTIFSQSDNQNYIRTRAYLDSTASSYLDKIQYFDGLGRPVQAVQKGITPSGADLVSIVEYDGVGREYRQYLPAPASGNNGNYVSNFASISTNQYGNNAYAYNETKYEASPLNRVLGQQGAGAAWQGHADSVIYLTNTANEVAYYSVTTDNKLKNEGSYLANSLYKTESKDEDGKATYEFKDKQGQVVLKQSLNGAEKVNTYYVYDDFGRLRYVLPPLASDALTATTTFENDNVTLKQYAYLYRYDERGNNIMKRLPGCDSISMVYDKADRMVLSQDGNQRLKNKWTVTKYDALGRVVYTGQMTKTINLQTARNTLKDIVVTESYDGSTTFCSTGYTCTSASTMFSGITPLTVNYYDNYGFLKTLVTKLDTTKLTYDSNTANDYSKRFANAKGLLTGTRTYILDATGTNFTASTIYYDDRGRVVQSHSSNHLGGYDRSFSKYDFAGKVLKTRKEHNIAGGTVIPEIYRYAYDYAGRDTTIYYQLGSGAEIVLVRKQYDELGRLIGKKRHNSTDSEEFDYNIRNWATRIMSGSFEEKLLYNTNLPERSVARYNGNIAASLWKYGTAPNGYRYIYDDLDRLKIAVSYDNSRRKENLESIRYDKQGNVTRLWRFNNGFSDNLVLSYNGNQIQGVEERAGNQSQYEIKEYKIDASATGAKFVYDKNGNLTQDLDRKIYAIRYNVLNLPDTVQFKNGNQIINQYDAGGKKLSTRYYTVQVASEVPVVAGLQPGKTCKLSYNMDIVDEIGTYYLDNFEYDFNGCDPGVYLLNKVYHQEGYTELLSSTNKYCYYRKDHLGNNREVWQAAYSVINRGRLTRFSSQTIQQMQYYPSGLPWAQGMGQSVQTRKYNGKEFDEMNGYDTYDYGARGMYAAIGRWTSVDPLAEKYYSISPYAYCAGNPVNRIDVEGMWIEGKNGDKATYSKKTGWVNASNDVIRIGNALRRTRNGRAELKKIMNNDKYSTKFIMSSLTVRSLNEDGTTGYRLGLAENKYVNGEINSASLTIYEGSIDGLVKQHGTLKGQKYFDLKDPEDRIAAVAAHEGFHLTDETNMNQAKENSRRKETDPNTKHLIDTEKGPNEVENQTLDELLPPPSSIKTPPPFSGLPRVLILFPTNNNNR